jgi:hypothetical protein
VTTNDTSTIDSVLFNVLTGDATLMEMLAPDNLPNGYQQSVYGHMVPEIDPVSRKTPRPPYVVFSMESGGGQDEYTLGLVRVLSTPTYRVTVCDTQTGGGSAVLVQEITDRIGQLIDGLIREDTTPSIAFRRMNTNLNFAEQDGGKVYITLDSIYRVFVH